MYTTKCILHKCTQDIQCDAYFNALICINFVSYFYVRPLQKYGGDLYTICTQKVYTNLLDCTLCIIDVYIENTHRKCD